MRSIRPPAPSGWKRRLLGTTALAALLALTALPIAAAIAAPSASASARAEGAAPGRHPASAQIESGRADVVAVTEPRTSNGIAALVGYLAIVVAGAGGTLWCLAAFILPLSAPADGRLRRWRAQLEGAPPALL